MLLFEVLPRFTYERQVPCNHLKQHDPEGVDVSPDVDLLHVIKLLRRHVGACARTRSCAGVADVQIAHLFCCAFVLRAGGSCVIERFRHPEVGDLERMVLCDEAVPRFDITVYLDAFGHCVIHSVTELDREAKHLREVLCEARRAYPALQIAPTDVFQE